jgi:antitoxin MazE
MAARAILRIAMGGGVMITKVQKWGNSQGVRLSKELLLDAEIDVGDAVDVAIRDGALVVTPVRGVRGGHDLRRLVSRIPKGYKPVQLDWGPPVGREVW